MAGLAAEERYGVHGIDRDAHRRPGGAIDAAEQIDGDYWDACPIHRLNHGARQAVDLAVKTGPEQGVDDKVAVREQGRRSIIERTSPTFCRARRVALQALAVADETYPHRKPALGQKARHDKTIATIIAGPRDHDDPAALEHRGNPVGNRA